MVNSAAFTALNAQAREDYRAKFSELDRMATHKNSVAGGLVPRDQSGHLKYETSMTPIQVKRTVAISVLVIALLATVGVIIAGFLTHNNVIFAGVAPAGVGMITSAVAMEHYSNQIDFASPKQREKEKTWIRQQATLSEMNKRYGGFDKVVDYQLAGEEVSASSYQLLAQLAQKQAEADRIYKEEKDLITTLYRQTIAPASMQLARVQAAMLGTALLTLATPHGYQTLPVVLLVGTAVHEASVSRQVDQVVQSVQPDYQQAMQNLHAAHQEATMLLTQSFRKVIPLGEMIN